MWMTQTMLQKSKHWPSREKTCFTTHKFLLSLSKWHGSDLQADIAQHLQCTNSYRCHLDKGDTTNETVIVTQFPTAQDMTNSCRTPYSTCWLLERRNLSASTQSWTTLPKASLVQVFNCVQFYAFNFSGTLRPHINGPTAATQDGRVSSVTPTDMLQNSGFLRSLTTEDFELKIPVTFPKQKT